MTNEKNVIGSINISSEGILIEGKKIHITGNTTFDNNSIPDDAISRELLDKINGLEKAVKYLLDVTKVQQDAYKATMRADMEKFMWH